MALLSGEEGFLSERLIASGRVQKKCFDMERQRFFGHSAPLSLHGLFICQTD
jgi:hypothetical protein